MEQKAFPPEFDAQEPAKRWLTSVIWAVMLVGLFSPFVPTAAFGGSLFRQSLGQAKFFVFVNCKDEDMAEYCATMVKRAVCRSPGFTTLDPETVRKLKSDEIVMAKLNDRDPSVLKEISKKYAVDYVLKGILSVDAKLLATQYEGSALLSVDVIRTSDGVVIGTAASHQVGGMKNPGPIRELALPAKQCAVTLVTNDIVGKLSLPGGFEPDNVVKLSLTYKLSHQLDCAGTAIAISSDNICYVGTSKYILQYDILKNYQNKLLCDSEVCSLAVWPDGSMLISGHSDGSVRAWDLSSKQVVWKAEVGNKAVSSLSLSAEKGYIAVGRNDGNITVFNRKSSAPLQRWNAHHGRTVHSLRFTYDGEYLLSAGTDRYVYKWEVSGRQPVFGFREIATANNRDRGELLAAEFTREGNIVAVALKDVDIDLRYRYRVDREYLCLHDCECVPPTEEYRFEAHDEAIESLVLCPTSCRFLASGSRDGKVKIWDMQLRQAVFEDFVGGWIADMAFSPEGNWFGVVSRKGEGLFNNQKNQVLKIWQVE